MYYLISPNSRHMCRFSRRLLRPTKTNSIGRLVLIRRHQVRSRCIRNNLIIDHFSIVASLPETSVPLAIERIEERSTMLSSMPMGDCTLRHGTRSQSGASSAPPSENRRLSQSVSVLYPMTAESKGNQIKNITRERGSFLSAPKLYPFPSYPPTSYLHLFIFDPY